MKQLLLKCFAICLMMMAYIESLAYDFAINNSNGVTIYYELVSNGVSVVANPNGGYSGDIVIPEEVRYSDSYNNYRREVTKIGSSAFSNCSDLNTVTIPNTVVSIDQYAFSGCSGLTSITLSNKVTNIGNCAFQGCSQLTSLFIPKSVKTIGASAFFGCTSLNKIITNNIDSWCGISFSNSFSNPLCYAHHLYSDDITEITDLMIPERVKNIGEYAFYSCSGLTSVTTPNGLETIGDNCFEGCNNLTNVTISEGLTSVGNNAFKDCGGLKITFHCKEIKKWFSYSYDSVKDVICGDEVTKINPDAFQYCTSLESIMIGKNVTSIHRAFTGCSQLKKVIIKDIAAWCAVLFLGGFDDANPLYYAQHLYCDENTEITDLIIPEGVISIGDNCFCNCSNLISVKIPSSLGNIGKAAFKNCTGLKKVIIEDVASWCGISFYENSNYNYTFYSNPLFFAQHLYSNEDTEIKDLVIPESITNINNYVFYNCQGLNSVVISEGVTSIGEYAFYDCSNLLSATIPQSVTSIGKYAFNYGSITLMNNNLTSGLNKNSLVAPAKIFVNKGTKTLLYLWNTLPSDYNGIYEIGANAILSRPSISLISSTQTTLKLAINGFYSEYLYTLDGKPVNNREVVLENLRPDYSISGKLTVAIDDYKYNCYNYDLKTKPISPYVKIVNSTVTSFSAEISHREGDAIIAAETVKVNNVELDKSLINENTIHLTGLDPNTSYNIQYIIAVEYGDNLQYVYNYTGTRTIKTDALQMTTQQPKVTSLGNAIVAAVTNLDDEESNVGFEWRRTDWGTDFSSNTAQSVLYEGTIEGYIRNLNTNYLWKYRPYYLSNSGTYYYGDWVGIDPTNTSYFEPTVHTYANISVEGNTALVKGYALEGTDNVTVQGFKYWKSTAGAPNFAPALSVPTNATTVIVSGQVMTTTLTNLDYGTTYRYVAFVTTSGGETFYGEEQSFKTEGPSTAIREAEVPVETGEVNIIGYYDLNGRRIETPTKGMNIIRYSNGATRKIAIQ